MILLQLNYPWRVGAQERGGEEGVENIPQAFLAPARDRVGSKKKGGGRSQEGR